MPTGDIRLVTPPSPPPCSPLFYSAGCLVDIDAVAGLPCAPVVTTVAQKHADHIRASPFRPVVSTGPVSSKDFAPKDPVRVLDMTKTLVGTLLLVVLVFHLLAFAFIASKPLGNGHVAQDEKMPYWKRRLAVSTLYLIRFCCFSQFLCRES